jgi:Pin2-interacting protein X1
MSAINDVKLNDTLNRAWKDDKTGFGFRMLQKMGWKEDKGLGKNEEGMTESVKVKRRGENEGLGTTKDQAGANGWTKTVSGFSAVLEMLNSSGAKSDPKIKKLKKSKKSRENVQVRIK